MLIVINRVILALPKNARQQVLCFYLQKAEVVAAQVFSCCPPNTALCYSGVTSLETYLTFHVSLCP